VAGLTPDARRAAELSSPTCAGCGSSSTT
jgi:hypothetical protein